MKTETYYLNNSGSRWIVLVDGRREVREWKTKNGKVVRRRVRYYESFGNFAVCMISYKGKIVRVFPDEVLED